MSESHLRALSIELQLQLGVLELACKPLGKVFKYYESLFHTTTILNMQNLCVG